MVESSTVQKTELYANRILQNGHVHIVSQFIPFHPRNHHTTFFFQWKTAGLKDPPLFDVNGKSALRRALHSLSQSVAPGSLKNYSLKRMFGWTTMVCLNNHFLCKDLESSTWSNSILKWMAIPKRLWPPFSYCSSLGSKGVGSLLMVSDWPTIPTCKWVILGLSGTLVAITILATKRYC